MVLYLFFRLKDWNESVDKVRMDTMKWNSGERVKKSKLNNDSRLKYPVCYDIESEIVLTMMILFLYFALQQRKEEGLIIRDSNK